MTTGKVSEKESNMNWNVNKMPGQVALVENIGEQLSLLTGGFGGEQLLISPPSGEGNR